MLHLVQYRDVGSSQRYKKKAEEWEDKVKKNEEHLKKLEYEKKREYEGELEWSSGIVLIPCRLTGIHTPD